MLTIRLRRAGSKRDPHYRVVVTDSRSSRDGRFVEILGHYHPRLEPPEIVLDLDKTQAWVDKGAQMSDTVRTLFARASRGDAVGAEVAVAAEAEAEPAAEEASEPEAAEPEAEEPAAEEDADKASE